MGGFQVSHPVLLSFAQPPFKLRQSLNHFFCVFTPPIPESFRLVPLKVILKIRSTHYDIILFCSLNHEMRSFIRSVRGPRLRFAFFLPNQITFSSRSNPSEPLELSCRHVINLPAPPHPHHANRAKPKPNFPILTSARRSASSPLS